MQTQLCSPWEAAPWSCPRAWRTRAPSSACPARPRAPGPGRRGPGCNCIKIGLPGKSILRDYLQENMISQRPFLLLRISFPGRPIFIQFVPGGRCRACAGGTAGCTGRRTACRTRSTQSPEGAVHEPTFKYRVTVGEFVATGCGQG